MNNKRFYNFCVVIYKDDENFDFQLSNLLDYPCIYAIHDNDVFEEDVLNEDGSIKYHAGDFKKPHYHFVVKLKNASTISAFAKKIGVAENMVEPVKKSLNGALKYLIHYGSENKYLYDVSSVNSTDDKLMRKFLDLVTEDISESEKVMSIQDFIDSAPDYVDIGILGKYVLKINMWDAFRRNITYFMRLVDNHNARISAKRSVNPPEYYDHISYYD